MNYRTTREGVTIALASAVVALTAAAPALAQQPLAEPTPSEASAALETAEAALAPLDANQSAEPAVDATVALNGLAAAYEQLDGRERRRAEGLLSRPTDGAADQYGDGYPAGAPVASAESAHFCVFWVNAPGFQDSPDLTDLTLNGIPDYVDSMLEIAEYSYGVEVAPGPLGWLPPKPDKQGCGATPSTRADIYLKQLGNQGLFGYESTDPGQGRARSQYGYMVLDNDYAESEYGYADPSIPAKVTFAHEFNHLLQQNYDSFQDVWMFESTAVWVEDKVYPEINDYLFYIRAFAKYPAVPITELFPPKNPKSLKIYGAGVWNHWLDVGRGYGVDVIRRAWEVSDTVDPADFAIAAYDRSISDSGGRSFSREFVPFAVATAEWRTGLGSFPDHALYPDVKRDGSLSKGGEKAFTLDHTAYRLLNVKAGSGAQLKLRVDVEDGVRSGVALIARDGEALTGAVKKKTRYLSKGGKASVTLSKPARYERITAVLVNADGRLTELGAGAMVYGRDDASFSVRLTG